MKKMLTSQELIEYMKNKGITFNIISEVDAKIKLFKTVLGWHWHRQVMSFLGRTLVKLKRLMGDGSIRDCRQASLI